MSLSDIKILRNIQEALEQARWKATIIEEMNALKKNNTWKYTEIPT